MKKEELYGFLLSKETRKKMSESRILFNLTKKKENESIKFI